ncbi:MAG: 4-alpha-glucanotransferase [Oscillospiraceae bacterium]|nr:4-alpha-glucanotransferase [Oscillospiraceae bacterium]
MRESGVLMHITSLPGDFGVGTMGKSAFAFVDFLQQAQQRCWQILPLTPTGYGDSPYQSCSTYAGNPYLIDLQLLIGEGLLQADEVTAVSWCSREDKVDFGTLYQNRNRILKLAYSRFADQQALDAFCRKHSSWLPDFALFMALKGKFQGAPWYQWEDALKFRQPDALWAARQELKEEIRFYCFQQYLFYTQWNALRSYAHSKDVRIIGDVPIYVPYDSADVWSSPEYFQLDENLAPTAVAGCPPDAFSGDGQLWGNPLYRWDRMEEDGFSWWLRRLAAAGELYDTVRIDHFRGLEAYWSVPYGDATARGGKWIKGPGMKFIEAIKKGLPTLDMIAEDLGFLTQEVFDLRDASGFPGMKILGFAFDSREPSEYLPHTYPVNSVCYTGTHDNMTTRQWFETASADAVAYAKEYMHLTEDEGFVWGMIRTAMASVSQLCITPMQDLLDLGGEARMNFPGTQTDANWTWRADASCMAPELAKRLAAVTRLYGRAENGK